MDRGLIGYTTTNGTGITAHSMILFHTNLLVQQHLSHALMGSHFVQGYSGAWGCDGPCTSIEVYRFYNNGFGTGRQWLISCEQFLEFPQGVSTVFMESPRSWATTSAESTTTSEASATETEDSSAIESESSIAPMIASRPFKASETSNITPTEVVTNNKGPDAGVIAGAVVGSLVGLAVIIGFIIMAFRMEKKNEKDGQNRGRYFTNIFPRLTISWTTRDSKEAAPTVYPIDTSNNQPGLIPTVEDMDHNLPPTYIYGSTRTELATATEQNEQQHLASELESQQVIDQNRVSELPSA
ncbi:unnamed protein product [Fusarium venenatum]|uniref:Uncharacterized protein n=1 Tax=Fusarium venenatum TaxID=56646 RepID=A0A2L2TAK6_9HYPO|nr:uncharacterized protein FVRRES_08059 [Fusarium venenatum]CEI67982.1 unnamed protein product [Fusarium venenatum]